MFDGVGRIILWVLAGIGVVVVVRRYGPTVLDAISSRQLPAAGGNRALPAPNSSESDAASPTAARLVSCGDVVGGGTSSGVDPLRRGVQSSPYFHWCYVARAGDSAGSVTERIVGDSARYQELLLANPSLPKKGTPGVVLGADAWDFADGAVGEGTKVFVPVTMNGWVDPFGYARGTYLPWPPDPRSILEVDAHPPVVSEASSTSTSGYDGDGDGYQDDGRGRGHEADEDAVDESGHAAPAPAWTDGFDHPSYVEGA